MARTASGGHRRVRSSGRAERGSVRV